MADDRDVQVRATGTPAMVERLMAAIRGLDVEDVTTRGPYQRNGRRGNGPSHGPSPAESALRAAFASA